MNSTFLQMPAAKPWPQRKRSGPPNSYGQVMKHILDFWFCKKLFPIWGFFLQAASLGFRYVQVPDQFYKRENIPDFPAVFSYFHIYQLTTKRCLASFTSGNTWCHHHQDWWRGQGTLHPGKVCHHFKCLRLRLFFFCLAWTGCRWWEREDQMDFHHLTLTSDMRSNNIQSSH